MPRHWAIFTWMGWLFLIQKHLPILKASRWTWPWRHLVSDRHQLAKVVARYPDDSWWGIRWSSFCCAVTSARVVTVWSIYEMHRHSLDIELWLCEFLNAFCKTNSAKIAQWPLNLLPRKITDFKSPGIHEIVNFADAVEIVK